MAGSSSSGAALPLAENTVIAERFHLGRSIGTGSFGTIYRGHDVCTDEQIAIKIEPRDASQPQNLLEEGRLLESLQQKDQRKVNGIPRVAWYGQVDTHCVLVMELLGADLDALLQKCSGKFSLKTVLQLADQMIDRLRYVHENNLLHRDVKPENFLLGRGDNVNQVYLVDFGLAKKYRDKRVEHIKFRQIEDREVLGTTRYASINAHKGIEPSRRDDLESLGYVLVYLCKGHLPWQGLKAETHREVCMKITERKLTLSVGNISRGLPEEFGEFINYCRNLKFEEEPAYNYLKELFRGLSAKLGFEYDGVFDWSKSEKRK